MKKGEKFWIFGILQAATLAFIVYFILQTTAIGQDTQIILSILFPLFLLLTEFAVYKK